MPPEGARRPGSDQPFRWWIEPDWSLRGIFLTLVGPPVAALLVLLGHAVLTDDFGAGTWLTLAAVLFIVATALFGVRALLAALTRLRDAALTVAREQLPATTARLSDPRLVGDRTPDEVASDLGDAVPIRSHDELGQLAYAFNVMHREAVRTAVRQGLIRREIPVMVRGIARRSQALVDRMIDELSRVPAVELDPAVTARLVGLGELAVRLRRNDENLMILAGNDPGSSGDRPLPLIELVHWARDQVEAVDRVQPRQIDERIVVTAGAVNDVARILAELIDNATRFSGPSSTVLVGARRIDDCVLIEVEDHGLGVTPAQLIEYNARLLDPPAADAADCRMLGLTVIARLAVRQQIRVQLYPNSGGGTVATVTLPGSLLVGLRPAPAALPAATGLPARPADRPALPPATGLPPLPADRPATSPAAAAPATRTGPAGDGPAVGSGARLVAPEPDQSAMIFEEIRASWFSLHGNVPTAGLAGEGGAPISVEFEWTTPADEGWKAAAAAAAGEPADTTPAGLPRRVPAARLVPGTAHAVTAPELPRRDPEQVRGTLSAYHRGVQRGRTTEEGQSTGSRVAVDEESRA